MEYLQFYQTKFYSLLLKFDLEMGKRCDVALSSSFNSDESGMTETIDVFLCYSSYAGIAKGIAIFLPFFPLYPSSVRSWSLNTPCTLTYPYFMFSHPSFEVDGGIFVHKEILHIFIFSIPLKHVVLKIDVEGNSISH